VPLDVKAGDTILFGKYAGQDLKLDGVESLIMKEDDALAVEEVSTAKATSALGHTSGPPRQAPTRA
jgi:chaperonin GroES